MSSYIPNTPEWEKMRKEKIGASDAPIIMGMSSYDTPYSLWQKKLDLIPQTSGWTKPMDRGHELEPLARAQVQDRLGVELKPQVKFHSSIPWMIATLDGLSKEGSSLVEIKCPGAEDHKKALAGTIPDKYFPQLQHQLEVCELESGYYFSFDGTEGVLIHFHRDDRYIKKLLEREKAFYENLMSLEPPDLTDRDFVTNESFEWEMAASLWKEARSALDRASQAEEEARKQLIALAGDFSTVGYGVRLSRCTRKGNVDYSKIPDLKEINLDLYRKKPTEYWKFSEVCEKSLSV